MSALIEALVVVTAGSVEVCEDGVEHAMDVSSEDAVGESVV